MLLAVALLAAAPAAALAGRARGCGAIADADAPHAIRAAGVTCPRAVRLAEAHWLVSGRFDACAPRKRTCRLRGFRCRWTTPGRETVRCARTAATVRFRYAG